MDDIELDNLDNKPGEEPEEQQEQETNIDDWGDQSIVIIDTSNPDAEIPNPRKDAGVIRRAYTEDKKNLLREMGVNINKGDGPSAKTVFEKLKITVNRKGRVNDAEYDGTRIIVQKGEVSLHGRCKESIQGKRVQRTRKKGRTETRENRGGGSGGSGTRRARERRSCQLRFKKQHRKLGQFHRRKGCRNRVS